MLGPPKFAPLGRVPLGWRICHHRRPHESDRAKEGLEKTDPEMEVVLGRTSNSPSEGVVRYEEFELAARCVLSDARTAGEWGIHHRSCGNRNSADRAGQTPFTLPGTEDFYPPWHLKPALSHEIVCAWVGSDVQVDAQLVNRPYGGGPAPASENDIYTSRA